MGYLLTEIVVYLVIAGLIGFAFGWAIKAGALDKYFTKLIELVKKVWSTIKGLFGKIISFFSNLSIFKKSSTTKEAVKSDSKDDEKFCLLTKIKEIWNAYYLTLTTSKKEETKAEVKVDVTEEAVVEVAKEVETEVSTPSETIEVLDDSTKPTLLTEAPTAGSDKLSSLKGIGPVLEKKLNELGVYTFEQIASWDADQELWIGTKMAFPKRVTKEEWVKQAKELLKNK